MGFMLDNCWVHGSSILTSVVIALSLILVSVAMPKLGAFRLRLVGAIAAMVFGIPLGVLRGSDLPAVASLDVIQCAFWFGLIVLLGVAYLLIGPGFRENVK